MTILFRIFALGACAVGGFFLAVLLWSDHEQFSAPASGLIAASAFIVGLLADIAGSLRQRAAP